MFAVDTNIFVYSVHKGAEEHEQCRELVEKCRVDAFPWATTWSIIYEFLRVSTHPRVFSSPLKIAEAWSFVEVLLASTSLQLLVEGERHADVAAGVFAELPDLRGNLTHDAHTAILLREHGVRQIYTRDTDFHRFPFLEVIDPLRA
jgi:toxin-antitoxin system PIN domain toxin